MERDIVKIPVVILVRVSTAKQDTERQISALTDYATRRNYEIVEVCRETISGRADESERTGLKRAEELVVSGKVKKVLVHEVSRLARKNSVIHRFVETLEEHNASLYWHAQGLDTVLENGKRNPAAAIMLALLAESARTEVETLRERIISGLLEARKRGRTLGRPPGTTVSPERLLRIHRDIVKRLKEKHSIRDTAKLTEKGISTVQRVKAIMKSCPA